MFVTEVVERAKKSFEKLQHTIEDIDPQLMASPSTIGEWSVKDVLNHIIIWEEEAAKAFEIWKVGIEPDWSHIADLDEFNGNTVEERRKTSLSKIREQLSLVHYGVLENVKSVPDEEYIKRGGVPKWLIILLTAHVDGHTERILEFKKSIHVAERESA
jgi:hypothetical protein